jgi:hypothetical protein
MTRASAFGSTILEMGSTKLCVSLTPSSLEDVFTSDVGGADCVEVRLDSLQNPLQSRDGTSAVTNPASAKEALHTWSDRVAIGIDARASVLVGPNIASLRQMLEGTGLRMIASGGVSGLDDVRALLDMKDPRLDGVIIDKAFYEGFVDLQQTLQVVTYAG